MQETVSDIVKSIFRFDEVYHIMTNTDQWTHQCRLPFQQNISVMSFNSHLVLEEAQRKRIYTPFWMQNWRSSEETHLYTLLNATLNSLDSVKVSPRYG